MSSLDTAALDGPDLEYELLLQKSKPAAIDWSNGPLVKELGQVIVEEQARAHRIPPPGVIEQETTFPADDGQKLRAKIYQPSIPTSGGCPLVVLIHGGGFCIGMPEAEEITARNVVLAHGVVAISIDYRHAPEYRFPFAVKDSWAGLRWIAANARQLGANPEKGFVIGGSSSGANITAVLTHLARDEGLQPPLTGHYLAMPAVGAEEEIPVMYQDRLVSYQKHKNAHGLSVAGINASLEMYKPDVKDGVYFSVINHPKGHAGLPPAYFQIAGGDPLRDQGLIYETILRETYGISTKLDVYPGLPHGFCSGFPTLSASKKYRQDQIRGIGWLLGSTGGVENMDDLQYDQEAPIRWTTKLWILWIFARNKLTTTLVHYT